MDVLAFKETRVVICDTCHTWGVLLGCSDIYSTTSVYLATTIDLVQHQPICQAQSKCLLSAACSLSLLYAVWTSVPSTCLFLSPYHLGPVLNVQSWWLWNDEGCLCRQLDQVVYKENLHHFMTTGATQKSLHSMLIVVWTLLRLYVHDTMHLPSLSHLLQGISVL